jgi:hypothetical protein
VDIMATENWEKSMTQLCYRYTSIHAETVDLCSKFYVNMRMGKVVSLV